jgi:hypothetical protein
MEVSGYLHAPASLPPEKNHSPHSNMTLNYPKNYYMIPREGNVKRLIMQLAPASTYSSDLFLNNHSLCPFLPKRNRRTNFDSCTNGKRVLGLTPVWKFSVIYWK